MQWIAFKNTRAPTQRCREREKRLATYASVKMSNEQSAHGCGCPLIYPMLFGSIKLVTLIPAENYELISGQNETLSIVHCTRNDAHTGQNAIQFLS